MDAAPAKIHELFANENSQKISNISDKFLMKLNERSTVLNLLTNGSD